MDYKFTLINRNGIRTEIDEPVGWDGVSISVSRDKEKHGIFFDYQGNDFEFYSGADIIKDEYDVYGIEGNLMFEVQYSCDREWKIMYTGRLLFAQYEYNDASCSARLPIETTSEVIELVNRIDQEVNLESLTAFDGVTALQKYNQLGAYNIFKAKSIVVNNEASNKEKEVKLDVDGGLQEVGSSDNQNFTAEQITIGFDKIVSSEIGSFQPYLSFNINRQNRGNTWGNVSTAFNFPDFLPRNQRMEVFYPLYASPFLNYAKEFPNYGEINGTISFNFRIKGSFEVKNCKIGYVQFAIARLPKRLGKLLSNDGLLWDNGDDVWHYYEGPNGPLTEAPAPGVEYPILYSRVLHAYTGGHSTNPANPINPGTTLSFDLQSNIDNFSLREGDRLYMLFGIFEMKTPGQINAVMNTNQPAYTFTLDKESFVKMQNNSKGGDNDASKIKTFLLNESLSRVTESITNNRIRVRSDFFGRKDSEPYSSDQDGEGSLALLTKGLFVRRADEKLPGRPPVMSLSLKDMWEGLNPIWNIGFGIEKDNSRPGFKQLRIENWKYFYKQQVLLSCDGVNAITKKVSPDDHYSTFIFGYEKWEAEEYTGLDEFLTKRKYRTTLSQVKNELQQLSKFVASGYAFEITRRKGNEDSKDWRYDQDIFIVTCKKTTYEHGGNVYTEIVPRQGGIEYPENIIDPDTIYNFDISPIRNAMRWADRLFAGYKNQADYKLIFTDGDGNFYAKGKNAERTKESEAISENETIQPEIFLYANDYIPLLSAERIEFEYPLSAIDFERVMENPYGIVQYKGTTIEGEGWINKITYKPNEGLAIFTLLPKLNDNEAPMPKTQKPVVATFKIGDNTLEGTSEFEADIIVKWNDTLSTSNKAYGYGWSVPVPYGHSPDIHDVIEVRAHAASKDLSEAVFVTIVNTTPVGKTANPTVTGTYGANKQGLHGTSEPDALITVEWRAGLTTSTPAQGSGWTIPTPDGYIYYTWQVIRVYATASGKLPSDIVEFYPTE